MFVKGKITCPNCKGAGKIDVMRFKNRWYTTLFILATMASIILIVALDIWLIREYGDLPLKSIAWVQSILPVSD